MFRACVTQWSYLGGMAGAMPLGLPAERVEAKARGYGVPADADFWSRFEVLEEEALKVMRS